MLDKIKFNNVKEKRGLVLKDIPIDNMTIYAMFRSKRLDFEKLNKLCNVLECEPKELLNDEAIDFLYYRGVKNDNK